jgi:dihydrodipicolinate synthase/N-acetylneuraminate lyase
MKGVHAAIVTHFDGELKVDHDAVAAEVNRLLDAGIHGIVPNGTVGEGGSLSRDERRAVIETVVGAAAVRGRRAERRRRRRDDPAPAPVPR